MNEEQWLAATDPGPMLEFLRGKLTDRKARLFAVACCRRIWHLLTDERSRGAVDVAERFADGRAAAGELRAAYRAARDLAGVYDEEAAAAAAHDDAGHAAAWASEAAAYGPDGPAWRQHFAAQRAAQAALLRDLIDPFRPSALDPSFRTARVLAAAEAAYSDRPLAGGELDPARLAALARALEDAGCHDAELLGHLRGEGPHWRGCWAVDSLLGRDE